MGAVDLVRILTEGGHSAIVMSRGGRLEAQILESRWRVRLCRCGEQKPGHHGAQHRGDFPHRSVSANATSFMRMAALPAWSAYIAAKLTHTPFVTSWYKAFREQNAFKHFYNSIMARGDRIIAVSDQLAELICERHSVPSRQDQCRARQHRLRSFQSRQCLRRAHRCHAPHHRASPRAIR